MRGLTALTGRNVILLHLHEYRVRHIVMREVKERNKDKDRLHSTRYELGYYAYYGKYGTVHSDIGH